MVIIAACPSIPVALLVVVTVVAVLVIRMFGVSATCRRLPPEAGFHTWILALTVGAISVPSLALLITACPTIPVASNIVVPVVTVGVIGVVRDRAPHRAISFAAGVGVTLALVTKVVPTAGGLLATGATVPVASLIVVLIVAIFIIGVFWCTARLTAARVQAGAIYAIVIPAFYCWLATSTAVPVAPDIVVFVITENISCIVGTFTGNDWI